jgi:protein-S-isoprenylcysteine O-methyltransferase Ste14
MRNPVKRKNLRLRFLPFHLAGVVLLLLSNPTPASIAIGSVPVAIGVAVRTWAAGHLVKNARFGVSGPYAHLRHPLYLGTFLIASGLALMLAGWTANLVLIAVFAWFFLYYFPRKERIESARLEGLYGEDFRAYRNQVPALLPRMWARPIAADERWSSRCYADNNELGTLLAVISGVGLVALRASFVT